MCAALILMLLMSAGGFHRVSAEGQGSVTLICRSDGDILAGMKWNIYKVGSRQDESFVPAGDFRRYYVRIDNFSAEHLSDMAYTLENVAILDRLPALDSRAADESGYVTFTGLEPGLYLLSGRSLHIDIETFKPSPILFEIKENDDAVQISAKIRRLLTLNGELTSHSVKKVWDDEDNKYAHRPESITVEIYMDDEPYTTAELNEANGWTFRWSSDIAADCRVKEINVPPKYTVIYRANDSQYAIVNTYDEESPVTDQTTTAPPTGSTVTSTTTLFNTADAGEVTKTSSVTEKARTTDIPPVTTVGERLPQTGKTGWSIPILALCGVVFAAFALRKKENS